MIAALYVVLTYLASALGLSSYVIQVRFSEALCILPIFTSAAIPGLFIGCLLSNFLTNCILADIFIGSLATLLGAVGTYLLRKHKILMLLPPILSNILIVPFILRYGYGFTYSIPYMMLMVGIGEIISIGVLGTGLRVLLTKYKNLIFPQS